MAATKDKYKPRLVSERWLTPFTTCSLVSWMAGDDASHLGESIMWPNGDYYGKAALRSRLKRGWTAVDPGRDDPNGYGRGDFNRFMEGIGSPLRLSEVKFTRPAEDIVEALRNGHGIAVAGNTRGTRALSPLRKWVGEVDHRIFVKGYTKVGDGKALTRLYDPMTPDTDPQHWGRLVPLDDIFDFGKRFKHWGRFFAERFKTGYYTREARARRRSASTVLQVQARLADVTGELADAISTITTLEQENAVLKEQLDLQPDRARIIQLAQELREIGTDVNFLADEFTSAVTVSPLR